MMLKCMIATDTEPKALLKLVLVYSLAMTMIPGLSVIVVTNPWDRLLVHQNGYDKQAKTSVTHPKPISWVAPSTR